MWDKFSFNKIDLQDYTVILFLGASLMMAIHASMMELAMSIGSGLLGYIGGTASSSMKKTDTTITREDVRENANQAAKDEAK
jgi:hypothetical protein